jgi:hypothetical protein
MKKVNGRLFAVAAVLVTATSITVAQTPNHTTEHVARIPAGSDLSSIKFQGVKMVSKPAADGVLAGGPCELADRGEPGGSMFCAPSPAQTYARVYQVTYSYEARPLASDEYNNRHYTFSVYFRPEELSDTERQVLAIRKGGRADAAATFEWTTTRELEARVVVDKANSTFCEGTYADGAWARKNPKCEDNVEFKTVAVPSDYVAVKVSLASPTQVAAAE